MKNIFVSEQTQILLQRMRDFPEDFFSYDYFSARIGLDVTWESIARKGHFNLIERLIINRALRKISREQTKQAILEKLITKKTDDAKSYPEPTITIPSGRGMLSNVATTITTHK